MKASTQAAEGEHSCGLPYFVNGTSALFDLPGNVLYLLTGAQAGDAELLTSGVLSDNIYACLDEDQKKVNCVVRTAKQPEEGR